MDEFRFHTGSIKRQDEGVTFTDAITFRFHTGSIKSNPLHLAEVIKFKSFDSILVRLKVHTNPR